MLYCHVKNIVTNLIKTVKNHKTLYFKKAKKAKKADFLC